MRTVREECLDWLLIFGRRQLERTLSIYTDHYNHQRPHRALALAPPDPRGKLIALPHRPRRVCSEETASVGFCTSIHGRRDVTIRVYAPYGARRSKLVLGGNVNGVH